MRHTLWTLTVACTFAIASPVASPTAEAGTAAKAGKAKVRAKARTKVTNKRQVSAQSKKALSDLMGVYRFGMSREEVISVLSHELDAKYAEKLDATTDVYAQDQLRKEKKKELARVSRNYITFDGKRTGWDVSLVEDQFTHKTGESMLVQWENQDGKNQRRFFFFFEGRLYKMFISLDTSVWPEESRTFEAFRQSMEARYGGGEVEDKKITWRAGDFEVRAIDKLRTYSALCLVIYSPSVMRDVEARRTDAAPPPVTHSAIINALIEDDDSKPDIRVNSDTVEAVKNAK